ncbi:MAG: hypothetical protein U0930_07780 [Pirellulales bacterium]
MRKIMSQWGRLCPRGKATETLRSQDFNSQCAILKMAEKTGQRVGSSRSVSGHLSAWVYAFVVLLVSTVLLICNALFCYVLTDFIPMPEDRIASAVISQLIYYLVPIGLTFFEWYLFDQLRRSVS